MLCSICGSSSDLVFKARVLSKYDTAYFRCPSCGFLQTGEPHWLDEAYRHAMNDEDTSILQRNWYYAEVAASVLFSFFNRRARFLDFGGGHGVFTRLMRDKGFDFSWSDPRGENIFARGFEYDRSPGPVELVTCIECFEHFTHPRKELEAMLDISSNIFFTTQLLPSPVPGPDDWDYYGLTHGQHIAFYAPETLRCLARRYGLRVHSNGVNLHLFTKMNFPDLRFRRALRPGFLKKLVVRSAMKSRSHADYEHIVKEKERLPR